MTLKWTWPVVFLFLCLSGCVSVNASVLSEARAAQPVPATAVDVYFADDSIPDHERIAILDARGSESWTNEAQMIDKLREKAGELGANAIILNNLRDPETGERVVAALFGGDAQRRGQAVAIYLKEPEEG